MKTKVLETSLGEACELYQPQTISQKVMIPNGEYPVFGANGEIGRYHSFNHEDEEVLVGCRGTCGQVNMSKKKSWITGNAMVVKPKSVSLNKFYLRYFMLGGIDYRVVITGAVVPQITRTSLEKVTIRIPSIQEQLQIVSILDIAFQEIATVTSNIESAISNLSELRQSLLQNTLFANIT